MPRSAPQGSGTHARAGLGPSLASEGGAGKRAPGLPEEGSLRRGAAGMGPGEEGVRTLGSGQPRGLSMRATCEVTTEGSLRGECAQSPSRKLTRGSSETRALSCFLQAGFFCSHVGVLCFFKNENKRPHYSGIQTGQTKRWDRPWCGGRGEQLPRRSPCCPARSLCVLRVSVHRGARLPPMLGAARPPRLPALWPDQTGPRSGLLWAAPGAQRPSQAREAPPWARGGQCASFRRGCLWSAA